MDRDGSVFAGTGDKGTVYKIAPDGSVRFFEINPRFGGSLLQPRQRAELRQALNCIFENAPPRP